MTLCFALYWFAQAVRGSDAEDSDVTVDGCGDVTVDGCGDVTVDGCGDGSEEEHDSRDYQSDGEGEDDNSSASENAKVLDRLDGGAPRKRRKSRTQAPQQWHPGNR